MVHLSVGGRDLFNHQRERGGWEQLSCPAVRLSVRLSVCSSGGRSLGMDADVRTLPVKTVSQHYSMMCVSWFTSRPPSLNGRGENDTFRLKFKDGHHSLILMRNAKEWERIHSINSVLL